MQLVPPNGGWLVGDGGLVMKTRDLGRNWQTPPRELPEYVTEHFDFHAVAVSGANVWVAGSPGTRVFHSPDGGESWQPQDTGWQTPIRALRFVDDATGWAVGDLGTILSTHDGGRSWQRQRQGGTRTALLAVFARDADVPLELLAKYGGEDAYLAAVSLLDSGSGSTTSDSLALAGATATDSAWRFPLPKADLNFKSADLVAILDRENDGHAIERLQSYLVRQLRMWRPSVVVTRQGDNPLDSLVRSLVTRAVQAAGDPTQYPDLSAEAGLTAWQVERVYGVLPAGATGDLRLATSQYAPRLGATLADWTAPARGMLTAPHPASPDAIELKLHSDATNNGEVGRDLFHGIHLAPGGEARRRLANLPDEDTDLRRRMALRRRQMQVLVERSMGSAVWAGQVDNLIAGLDDQSSGELLFELANGYRESGRLDLAADTMSLVVRRWPDHPLSAAALTWLVQFYASSEAAHASVGEQATNVRAASVDSDDLANGGAGAVRQARAMTAAGRGGVPSVGLSRDDRLRRAVTLGNYLAQVRPQLYAEPAVRFPLIVAERQLGFANPAKRYYLTLRSLPVSDPWHRCAQTEEWFAKPEGVPPPKALGHCRQTVDRPHLDGRLDEPLWESADRLRLGGRQVNSESSNRADVRLTYDREFLYVAVRCPKMPAGDYAPNDGPRPRDADLIEHDRVTIEIDVDRDFTTAYSLAVDERGWTHDACWGNMHWDPTWYVAADGDEATWTVEAAIPLGELAAEPPAARHVWAVAVRRTIPRVGYESWAGDPADDSTPDRFGLLIFE
jgi:hypothetical protein